LVLAASRRVQVEPVKMRSDKVPFKGRGLAIGNERPGADADYSIVTLRTAVRGLRLARVRMWRGR
jgi:hypothetical protein